MRLLTSCDFYAIFKHINSETNDSFHIFMPTEYMVVAPIFLYSNLQSVGNVINITLFIFPASFQSTDLLVCQPRSPDQCLGVKSNP